MTAPANEGVWRQQPGGLCWWNYRRGASRLLPQQGIVIKVGGRKRNGWGIHVVSHCNRRALVPMGHLYKCTFSTFFKRPQVELESRDSKLWIEARSAFWFRPCLVRRSVVWCDKLAKVFRMSEWVCSTICRVQGYGCVAGNLGDKKAQFIQNQLILHFVGTKWRILQNVTTYSYK